MEDQTLLQYATQNFGDELISIAVIGALGGLVLVVGKVIVGIIRELRHKTEVESSSGISFEDRLANVETNSRKGYEIIAESLELTKKIADNHLEHLKEDLQRIEGKIDDYAKDAREVRERVIILETKQKN